MRAESCHSSLSFVAPVVLENVSTTLIGLVFSSLIGQISGSALAMMGLVNTFLSVLTALTTFLATGAAILVAHLVGEGKRAETGVAVEQTALMGAVVGLVVTAVCEAFAQPLLSLMVQVEDPAAFQECLIYYRTQMLSFPFLMISNPLSGVMRAAGESKAPMANSLVINLVQLLAAYLLIDVTGMGMMGAGLAYVICRAVGAGLILVLCLHSQRHYTAHLRNMLRPQKDMIRHICRLGFPATPESLSVQLGYLLTNSWAVALGTREASVNQIVSTLNSFPSVVQAITIVIGVTLVGQRLGAKQYEEARQCQKRIMLVSMGVAMPMGLALAIFGYPLAGLYTSDPVVQQESARLLWLMLGYCFFGLMINVNDPILRVAGDTRFVMTYTILGVWLVRIPLTWLFAYALHWGAFGVQLANVLSLIVRAACGVIRLHKGQWVYLKI